jgi:uncharacterized membrane protein YdjX (TVP38/TMEM64 family)
VVTAQRLGLFHLTSDPVRLKQAVLDLGPWGYAAFIGAYTVLQPFGVPGTVFVVAAPLIWPWPIAFALSMIGTLSASVVGFSFARFVARDWVEKVVPARFHAYDEALARRGFVTVFTLRLIFWMPPPLHVFFGISRVPFWTHFWGSAAGYFLPLLATSYFGPKALDALLAAPRSVWIGAGVVAVAIALTAWALRRRRRGTIEPLVAPDRR